VGQDGHVDVFVVFVVFVVLPDVLSSVPSADAYSVELDEEFSTNGIDGGGINTVFVVGDGGG
jgi:hypothetical protein